MPDKLREALDLARQEYRMCEFIDSTARRDREQAALATRIAALTARIADMDRPVTEPVQDRPAVCDCHTCRETGRGDLFGPLP